jgi:hypothetical protein
MTRGKHGASSALRRAEQAEARAVKWEAEAREWKRLAHQHVANARRAEALERALRKERGQDVGIPEADHAAQLAEVEAAWQERYDELLEATVTIGRQLLVHVDRHGDNYINAMFLRALRVLPEEASRALTAGAWNRDDYRAFMQPGAANVTAYAGRFAAIAVALANDIKDGRIPEDLVGDPSEEMQRQVDRVMHRKMKR